MPQALDSALDSFINTYIRTHREAERPMVVQYDSDWPSPCYQQQGEEGEWVDWLPVKREPTDLAHLEQALDLNLHPQVKAFFTAYFSDNLDATTSRGNLQLLLPWNEEDFERLQQNLIGHVLMKRRLGQAITLFFAVTDEDDFILSVDNTTGQVMLEQVGLEPREVLADSLADFIASLTPRID